MRRELARIEPWQARIDGTSQAALKREVARAFRRGELAAVGPMHATDAGYAVEVWRLKDRPVVPAWRRPVLIAGGTVVVLGAATALGWWLFAATGPLVMGGLAALGGLRLLTLRRSGCTTTVTVTHRHR